MICVTNQEHDRREANTRSCRGYCGCGAGFSLYLFSPAPLLEHFVLLSPVSSLSHQLLPTLSLSHLTKKQPRTWSLCYPSATHASSPPSPCPLLTLASQETPHLLQSGFLHGKTRARHQYRKMGHPGTNPRSAGDRGPQRAKDTFGG